jgi:hypothetical protein
VEEMTGGSEEEAILRLVVGYLPLRDGIKDQLSKIANDAVLLFLISREIYDRRGRVVASVGSLDDDLEGHIVLQMSENIAISRAFLDAVLSRFVERHCLGASALTQHIRRASVFLSERASIIERGLEAYLNGDHLTAAHVLIPQIENAIRELVELQGAAVLKPGRGGGFQLKTLDELLRDPIVKSALGDDLALYLRVLLTDQRGWNLRNDVCHGLLPAEAFQKPLTDRLLHALLCLSLIRASDEASEQPI